MSYDWSKCEECDYRYECDLDPETNEDDEVTCSTIRRGR